MIDNFLLLAHDAASLGDRLPTFRGTVMLPFSRVWSSESNVICCSVPNVQPTICVNVYGSEIRSVHFRNIDAITRVPKFLQFDFEFVQYAHPTFLELRRPGEKRRRTSENISKMGVSGVGRESVDFMYYVARVARYMLTIRNKCIC